MASTRHAEPVVVNHCGLGTYLFTPGHLYLDHYSGRVPDKITAITIPTRVMTDARLKAQERATLVAMYSLVDESGWLRLVAADLAKKSHQSVGTVNRHRRRLSELGWLVAYDAYYEDEVSERGLQLRYNLDGGEYKWRSKS